MTQGIKEAVKHGKFMLYNSGNLNFSKLEIDTVQTLIDYALSSQATKVSGLPGFKQEGLKILKKLVQSYTGMPDETVDFCLDDKYFDQALKEIGDLPIVRSQVSVDMIQGFPKKRNCHKTYTVCCGGCLVDRTINECSLAVMKMLDKEMIERVIEKTHFYLGDKDIKFLAQAIVDYWKDYMKGEA